MWSEVLRQPKSVLMGIPYTLQVVQEKVTVYMGEYGTILGGNWRQTVTRVASP